jgi:hypothetical protein
MRKINCPSCNSRFSYHPDYCNCGYPINGSELDQYRFMTSRMHPPEVSAAKGSILKTWIMLLLIGINLLLSAFFLFY